MRGAVVFANADRLPVESDRFLRLSQIREYQAEIIVGFLEILFQANGLAVRGTRLEQFALVLQASSEKIMRRCVILVAADGFATLSDRRFKLLLGPKTVACADVGLDQVFIQADCLLIGRQGRGRLAFFPKGRLESERETDLGG